MALGNELQKTKRNLSDFYDITVKVLDYLPIVINDTKTKNYYQISSSTIAGTKKYLRPVNKKLFIENSAEFKKKVEGFKAILKKIKNRELNFSIDEKTLINSVTYTIQQSIGLGFDLLVNPNSARKHVGNRFEELIRCIFSEIGVANKRTVLQIPYETEQGIKIYKCENDLILSPFNEVKSTAKHLDKNEIVVSAKTSSKDRMGKMFIDKMLLERFVKHEQKVIGIFLNDVQRKSDNNISYTLVSGLFMVYTSFLTQLEGIYYLDPPPNIFKEPFSKHMGLFSDLLTKDLWTLLAS